MIVVLQAARDGKELEYRKRPDEDTDKTWRPMTGTHLREFNFANYEYRLKTKAYANDPPKVTRDKAIEILQALKDGKEIEFRIWQDPTNWRPWTIEKPDPGMFYRDFPDFSCYDYRVKPEMPDSNDFKVINRAASDYAAGKINSDQMIGEIHRACQRIVSGT
jgi:hypothetical protein